MHTFMLILNVEYSLVLVTTNRSADLNVTGNWTESSSSAVGALRRRGGRRRALGPWATANGRPVAGEVTAAAAAETTTTVGLDPWSSVVVVGVPLVSATPARHTVSIVTAIIGRATKILMHAASRPAEISIDRYTERHPQPDIPASDDNYAA